MRVETIKARSQYYIKFVLWRSILSSSDTLQDTGKPYKRAIREPISSNLYRFPTLTPLDIEYQTRLGHDNNSFHISRLYEPATYRTEIFKMPITQISLI